MFLGLNYDFDDYQRPAFSLASTSYQNNNAPSSGYHEEVSSHIIDDKSTSIFPEENDLLSSSSRPIISQNIVIKPSVNGM